jgi:outer membrane receptor protein involved in Fe transport
MSLASGTGVLTLGANYLDTQTGVDLRPVVNRDPIGVFTSAHARINNGAGYAHQNLSLADGRLLLGGGLRWDLFRFDLRDRLEPNLSGTDSAVRMQPKASLAYTPSHDLPLQLHVNYGRGISSLDARGVVREPAGPFIATTDFLQFGTAHRIGGTLNLRSSFFLIQPSNQLVYIPDDGSLEFADPSRSYGIQVQSSVRLNRYLSLDGGLTRVFNAYYRDILPRVYLDSAPHLVANAAFLLSNWRGWSGSFRMRAINHYRLDGEDPSIRAAGHTVFDFAMSKRLRPELEFNFALDNLLDRAYWETQNFFESRLPGQDPIERIHATPGYGRNLTVGLTFRFGGK